MASMKDIMSTTGQTVKAGVAPVAAVGRGGKQVVRGVAKAGAAVAGGVAATAAALQDPDEFAYQAAKGALLAGGAKILGIGKKVFADNKEKKEAKDKHDTLHKDASKGSPERQPISDEKFGGFSEKVFNLLNNLVEDSKKETAALVKEELSKKEETAEGKKLAAGKLQKKSKRDKKKGGFDWWKLLLFGGIGAAVFFGIKEFKKVLESWEKTYDSLKKKVKSFTDIFTNIGDKIKNFLKSVGLDFGEDEKSDSGEAPATATATKTAAAPKVEETVDLDDAESKAVEEAVKNQQQLKQPIKEQLKVVNQEVKKDEDLGLKPEDFEGDDDEAPKVIEAKAKKEEIENEKAVKESEKVIKASDKVISDDAGKPEKMLKDVEKAGDPKEAAKIIKDTEKDDFEKQEDVLKTRSAWIDANNEYLDLKKKYEEERRQESQKLTKGSEGGIIDEGGDADLGDRVKTWEGIIKEIKEDKELSAEERKEELAEIEKSRSLIDIDKKYEADLVKLEAKAEAARIARVDAEKKRDESDKADDAEDARIEKEFDKLEKGSGAKTATAAASPTTTISKSVTGSAGGQKTDLGSGVTKTAGANQTTTTVTQKGDVQRTTTTSVTGGGSIKRTMSSELASADDKQLAEEREGSKIKRGLMRAKREELGFKKGSQARKDPTYKAFREELKKMSIEDLRKMQAEVLPPMNAGDMKGEVATGGGKAIQDAKRLAAIQANAARGTTNPDATLHAANHAQGS